MTLISCKDLTIGHEGKVVVRNLNFSVGAGDYLCIVGENGSGKSTLIKTLLGLIAPLSGSVIFGDGLLQTEIGYLPQQTIIQRDFPASVHEVVLSGCLNNLGARPFYGKREKQRVQKTMDHLGISSLIKQSYRDLSGGQQQKVLLARALCATHKLLLLDEPVAGLDPHASEEMYRTIHNLNAQENITIIMISHDVDEAINHASHVLHIEKQRTLFFGTRKQYHDSGYLHAPCPICSDDEEASPPSGSEQKGV